MKYSISEQTVAPDCLPQSSRFNMPYVARNANKKVETLVVRRTKL